MGVVHVFSGSFPRFPEFPASGQFRYSRFFRKSEIGRVIVPKFGRTFRKQPNSGNDSINDFFDKGELLFNLRSIFPEML